MSHLIITYFENLNPSLYKIKYLCDQITQGNFDCGSGSYEKDQFKTKFEIYSIKDSKISTLSEDHSQTKKMDKTNVNMKSLSEMLSAANKAKQIVNSLRKSN